MASIEKHGRGCRVKLYVRGVPRRIWLGNVCKSAALEVCRHLDALNIARDTATSVPPATRRWLACVHPRIATQLVAYGLAEQQTTASARPRQLGPFVAAYLEERAAVEDLRPRSLKRLTNAANHLTRFLGGSTALAAVTRGDADRYARHLASVVNADSHAGKLLRDARHFFRVAERDRIIDSNPFAAMKTSQQQTAGRSAYISAEAIERITAASDPHLALLLASARWAGLRVPSEPLALEWSQVDFAAGRVTVTAPKTHRTKPRRVVPMFPAWRASLEKWLETDPPGAFVFSRWRSSAAKTWRGQLMRAAKSAGFDPWPKLWHNLRASCRTDLLAAHPVHVVDYWLGHSTAVGRKHYELITDDHYERAATPAGEPIGDQIGDR
jgi:integrase